MKRIYQTFLTAFIMLLLFSQPKAQLSLGGKPKSMTLSASQKTAATAIPVKKMGSVDVQALLAEDALDIKKELPMRFGYPFPVDYDLTNSGIWETSPDGTRIWRLVIEAPNAYSINLLYSEFNLPDGVRFYIYNEDQSMILGAFTSQNNKTHGRFATAPIQGDKCILELNVPSNISYPGRITISTVIHAYKDLFKDINDFGESGSCNINVNCSDGDNWRNQIRSVAMVILGNGFRLCSGTMLNNVRQDLTPYLLTAEHCNTDPENWIIMFNYQSPACSPTTDGPTTYTVQGTTLRAHTYTSDFCLVELDEPPPDSFNIFYAGWSNLNSPADSTTVIHHPSADVKKISFNDDPTLSTNYYSHIYASAARFWRVDNWEDGTTEEGSSGSALFDQNKRVVGQLTGGAAACIYPDSSDWFGKIYSSWNYGTVSSSRLKDWLDPDAAGATVLDGIDHTGLYCTADTTYGWAPLSVNFSGFANVTVNNWEYDFGDGNFDYIQNPTHNYLSGGLFDINLTAVSGTDTITYEKPKHILVLADTLKGIDTNAYPGSTVEVVINAVNNFPTNQFIIPFQYSGNLELTYDSFSTAGCRTDYFEDISLENISTVAKQATIKLTASNSGTQPELPAGDGAIAKIYFTADSLSETYDTTFINIATYSTYEPTFSGSVVSFTPALEAIQVVVPEFCCIGNRGDVNGDGSVLADISDLLYLVDYQFSSPSGPAPPCEEEADVNGSGQLDISDVLFLVDYMFQNPAGDAPHPCFE